MKPDEIKAIIKASDIDFLKVAKKSGFICPFCNSGAGPHGTGIEEQEKVDSGDRLYWCHGCNKSYDAFSLYARARDFKDTKGKLYYDIINKYASEKNIIVDTERIAEPSYIPKDTKQDNYWNFKEPTETNKQDFINYIVSRGIDPQTNIIKNEICIGNRGQFNGITWETVSKSKAIRKASNGKSIYWSGSPDITILKNDTNNKQYIFVVEGIFDALPLYENNYNVICLNSINNKNKFKNYVNSNIANLKDKIFLVVLDKDENGAGQKAQQDIIDFNLPITIKTPELLFKCVDPNNIDSNLYFNDVNDLYLNFGKDFFVNRLNEIINNYNKEIEKQDINSSAFYIKNQYTSDLIKFNKRYPTNINGIDTILNGGFNNGLTIIGAETGLGKTSFCLQIADFLASKENIVLYFSLEMGKVSLITRSLKRLSKDLNYNSSENIEKYCNYVNNNLKIFEGTFKMKFNDIEKQIKYYKERTDKDIVVFIDYLQAIQPDETSNKTDKQINDIHTHNLYILSQTYNIPIIAISSLNRDSYGKQIQEKSFKETGAIEYTADVIIALEYINQEGITRNEKANILNKGDIKINATTLKYRPGKPYQTTQITFTPNKFLFK